jgi:hypothetical protein
MPESLLNESTRQTALKFINTSGASTHGNLRPSSIFTSPSGEWKLGGFELLSTLRDASPVLYVSFAYTSQAGNVQADNRDVCHYLQTQGGLLPDSGRFSSPEVRKSGWEVLKELVCTVHSLRAVCRAKPARLLLVSIHQLSIPTNFTFSYISYSMDLYLPHSYRTPHHLYLPHEEAFHNLSSYRKNDYATQIQKHV